MRVFVVVFHSEVFDSRTSGRHGVRWSLRALVPRVGVQRVTHSHVLSVVRQEIVRSERDSRECVVRFFGFFRFLVLVGFVFFFRASGRGGVAESLELSVGGFLFFRGSASAWAFFVCRQLCRHRPWLVVKIWFGPCSSA